MEGLNNAIESDKDSKTPKADAGAVCMSCGCRISDSREGIDDQDGATRCRDCYYALFYPGTNTPAMNMIDF